MKSFLFALWRRAPKWVRRAGVLLTESRFIVTAGAIVVDAGGRVLLLRHSYRPGSGWGVPGGFLLPREQPDEALRRELREEIGLEIQIEGIALIRTLQKYQQVEILFLCHPAGEAIPRGVEILRAEWFPVDALPPGLGDDQRELIERALRGMYAKREC